MTSTAIRDAERTILLLQNERMSVLQNLLRQLMRSMAVFEKHFENAFVNDKIDSATMIIRMREMTRKYEEQLKENPDMAITPDRSEGSESDEEEVLDPRISLVFQTTPGAGTSTGSFTPHGQQRAPVSPPQRQVQRLTSPVPRQQPP